MERCLRATDRELVEEALEVVGGKHRRDGAAVAVGVQVAGGELVEEALEVVDVEDGRVGRGVAVGVAGVWHEYRPEPAGESVDTGRGGSRVGLPGRPGEDVGAARALGT